MSRRLEFQRANCGCMRYSECEGSRTDEYGDFTDYWCDDCEQLTRMDATDEED